MGKYILRRLLNLVPALFGISLVSFFLAEALPGDAISLKLGQHGDRVTEARLRKQHGYDDSAAGRYVRFIGRAARGDFGESVNTGEPVVGILAQAFVPTLQLAVGAMLFALIVGIPAGLVCAVWPRSWADLSCMALALVGVSMPVFWLGLVLIVFVAQPIPWLPSGGYEAWNVRYFILPWITLGTVPMALIARLTRASVLDTLGRDYVRVARAKGLDEFRVVLRYGLRPALIPIITVVGGSLASLLSGAALTESVFGIPGLGREVFTAIKGRESRVVAGAVMWFACTFVFVNLGVDLLYAALDPRVRLGAKR